MSRTPVLFVAQMLVSVLSFAQVETGAIAGRVTDPTNAVVPDTTVIARSDSTRAKREARTTSAGTYLLPSLRPDTYEVIITKPGFARFVATVRVCVGRVLPLNVTLRVGSGIQTVEIPPRLNSCDVPQAMGSHFTPKMLGLSTQQQAPYQPSGNPNGDTNDGSQVGGSPTVGIRSVTTKFQLDGGQNVDFLAGTVGQKVPLDSLKELGVLINNLVGENGKAGSGVVSAVTQSGGNVFHGSAYEYNGLSALSSNTYQNNATGIPKGRFTRNQFGFALGSPIAKNKLFFFNNTEWIRVRGQSPISLDLMDQRSYASLASASQLFFKQYGTFSPSVKVVSSFPCVPGSMLACDAVKFNAEADAGGGAPQNTWIEIARVDYNWSSNNTVFGRYAAYNEVDFPGSVSSSPYAGYNFGQDAFDQSATVNWTHTFPFNLTNTLKVIFNRLNGPNQPLGTAPVSPTLYTSSSVPALANGLPLVFPGYNGKTPTHALPIAGPENQYQFYDDISWAMGAHAFKFGGSYIQVRDNRSLGAYNNSVEYLGTGLKSGLEDLADGIIYQFQGAIDSQSRYPCPKNEQGQYQISPACTLQLPVGPPAFQRNSIYNESAIYGQDSWHPCFDRFSVICRLTVNLGLRWDYYGVQHDSNPGLDSNFVLGLGANLFDQIRNGAVKPASEGGVFWNPERNNFSPHIGFAYDVFGNGETSIRGGYGISYESPFGSATYAAFVNPPSYGLVSLVSKQDVPFAMPVFADNAGPLAGSNPTPLPALSLRTIDQKLDTGYVERWDFSFERQLTRDSAVTVSYAGEHGVHLYDMGNINSGTGGNPNGSGGGNVYLGDSNLGNRVNYQYSNMLYRGDGGYSHYKIVSIRYSGDNMLGKGLFITASYTWSHDQDNLPSAFTELYGGRAGVYYPGHLDAFNPTLDYGNSDYNISNQFVLGGVWELPWMKNAREAVARQVIGGWSVGSIVQLHSGLPFNVYDCDNFNGMSCPLWVPNQGTPQNGSNLGPVSANVFNYLRLPNIGGSVANLGDSLGLPNCAGLAHQGCTYTLNGAAYPARNVYTGPGYWNVDIDLHKNFKLTETLTLQFRSEMYNVLNHHNLYITGLNLDASSLPAPYVQAEKGGSLGYAGQPTDERRNIRVAIKLIF